MQILSHGNSFAIREHKECCYPDCGAKPTQKVHEPLCDRHLVSVFRSVDGLVLEMHNVNKSTPRGEVKGLVYFIRFGDRVKIGFSTNTKRRLQSLPHDEMLAFMPGTFATEKQMHNAFRYLRIKGEWFSMGQDLLDFIEENKTK